MNKRKSMRPVKETVLEEQKPFFNHVERIETQPVPAIDFRRLVPRRLGMGRFVLSDNLHNLMEDVIAGNEQATRLAQSGKSLLIFVVANSPADDLEGRRRIIDGDGNHAFGRKNLGKSGIPGVKGET